MIPDISLPCTDISVVIPDFLLPCTDISVMYPDFLLPCTDIPVVIPDKKIHQNELDMGPTVSTPFSPFVALDPTLHCTVEHRQGLNLAVGEWSFYYTVQ